MSESSAESQFASDIPQSGIIESRVSFGHPDLKPNRLFWGDNLHVMRQLPSESIDLIYIDPPFFSGRQYNVIFGDQNELRSFSDIWEGGMPSYLIWLSVRFYEMKRLLKKTGSIYVHCDWHASHYIKVEMDKIFGYENLLNEVIWSYRTGGVSKQWFSRKHDVLLFYARNNGSHGFNVQRSGEFRTKGMNYDEDGRPYKTTKKGRLYFNVEGPVVTDVWEIPFLSTVSRERIGYPTQKPEALLERVISASSNEGDVLADFFCGSGTMAAVAQRMARSWIACDQSRVAVAITADRLTRQVEEQTGNLFSVPDFTVEPCLTASQDEPQSISIPEERRG